MANNDEYTDEYNDEHLCRDFFVGFNFWSRLSFQISEFRVHWLQYVTSRYATLRLRHTKTNTARNVTHVTLDAKGGFSRLHERLSSSCTKAVGFIVSENQT